MRSERSSSVATDAGRTGAPSGFPNAEPLLAPPVAATRAVLVIMSVTFGYWLWFGLFRRNISHDDGISLLAVQGILRNGSQILPSGYSYGRGFLHHYLIAGSASVFGLNDFSAMLPSLVMGLFSVFLIYRIGADILQRPWLGVAASALLVTLSIETWYATGPRMYMPLQFFSTVAIYGWWKGFVEGAKGYQVIAVLALLLGTMSNQEGAIITLALPVSTLIVLWLRREPWKVILSVKHVVVVAALGLVTYVLATYEPANSLPLIIGHGGTEPDRVGVNLNLIDWGRHVLQLERSIPYSLGLFLVAYFAFFRSVRRSEESDQRWAYLFVVFATSFLIHGIVIKTGGHRHIFFVLPLYALIVCFGVLALSRMVRARADRGPELGRAEAFVSVALFAIGLIVSVSLSTLKQLHFGEVASGRESVGSFVLRAFSAGTNFTGLAKDGYGLPCGYDYRCDRSLQEQLGRVGRLTGPNDLVVSGLPMETSYYLGRLDGWLFFRSEGESYPLLELSPTDEYYGVEIVDSPAELRQLASQSKVWVIVPITYEASLVESDNALWNAINSEMTLRERGDDLILFESAAPHEGPGRGTANEP